MIEEVYLGKDDDDEWSSLPGRYVNFNDPRFHILINQYVESKQFMNTVSPSYISLYHAVDVCLRTEQQNK